MRPAIGDSGIPAYFTQRAIYRVRQQIDQDLALPAAPFESAEIAEVTDLFAEQCGSKGLDLIYSISANRVRPERARLSYEPGLALVERCRCQQTG
jgi:hypothetical protein